VTAAVLATELEVSVRSIYRDIATLIAQGAPIEGAAGLGYVLRPGFLLPPLMFGDDEIDALVLGLRWVAQSGDDPLGMAAADALAKIAAVLPAALRDQAEDAGLLAGPGEPVAPALIDLADLRRTIRAERKLRISYVDGKGRRSERTIWPFALGFFDGLRIVAAWCELRQDFRHFRTDRIIGAAPTGERYPRRRRVLLAKWRTGESIAEPI
jgi:predicted DNA-binding transcriptional regulator YafY